jgi:hypothetical protein
LGDAILDYCKSPLARCEWGARADRVAVLIEELFNDYPECGPGPLSHMRVSW